MPIAGDGSTVPLCLPKMRCGGIPVFDVESEFSYRCDFCFAVIGSMGQSDECKEINSMDEQE